MRSNLASLSLVALLAIACSSAPSTKQLEPSGFLMDWDQLQPHPDPEREGALLYVSPTADLGAYQRVFVPTPVVLVDPAEADIPPDQMLGVADDFVLSIHRHLKPDYKLVPEPGPGTLVMRVAITDFEKTGGFDQAMRTMTGRGQGTRGVDPQYETRSIKIDAMGIEAELLDGATQERLVALAEYQTAKHLRSSREQTWGTIQAALDFWAERLREALDQAHGKR